MAANQLEQVLISDEAQFALRYVSELGASAAGGLIGVEDQAAVAEFVGELANVDEQLLVLRTLYGLAEDRSGVEKAIEMAEDDKYGDGILEVTREEMPNATRRVLEGKNPFVVVRADQWRGQGDTDTGTAISNELRGVGTFRRVGTEKFPHRGMALGSSRIHLDNFAADPTNPGFRYTFSAAEIETGSVLYIAGFGRGKALVDSPKIEGVSHPYDVAQAAIENHPSVRRLYDLALSGRPPARATLPSINGTQLYAVTLNAGDVVMWPQGGPGSKTPDWHGFRQIGDQPRTSVSYHYIQQM